jgi:hypothetical protein
MATAHEFNWALDYFDVMAAGNDRPALWVVNEDGSEQKMSFPKCRSVRTRSPTGCARKASGAAIAS